MNAVAAFALRRHLLIGLAALLLGLLLQLPAPLLVHWAKPKDGAPAVELRGVEGSLLAGRAAGALVNGRPALQDMDWQLRPWWLLLANVSAHISARADQSLLEADVSAWPGGRLSARSLNFSGSIKALLAAAGQPYLPIDGMARLVDAQISLKDGWPRTAEGLAQVQGLAWTLAASPIVLGDFEAKITTTGGEVSAALASVSGPLELKGSALLKADRSYQLDLAYRPKPEATPVLRNLLASNGAPDASGWYHIRQQKQAPPPPTPQ